VANNVDGKSRYYLCQVIKYSHESYDIEINACTRINVWNNLKFISVSWKCSKLCCWKFNNLGHIRKTNE